MHNIKSITKKDRYGNMFSFEMFEDKSVPLMIMVPDMPNGFNGADTDNHPGNPKGTDTVPAWLTPGENVVNAEASRIPGNQEKIDQMNDQGRQMQAAQGGPIPSYAAGGMQIPRPDGMLNSLSNRLGDRNGGPMYAAMGTSQDDYSPYNVPSWFTPDILEKLIQTESGNNNQAVNSRSGATGAAQIMADTALDPGYNVQPLTLEQRKDPELARRFATQYISGIQKEHPNFTPAQVLQAYNAGPRRMALNIDGEYFGKKENSKPLAQETIDYPAKILGKDFVPPRSDTVNDRRDLKNQQFNIKAINNNLKNAQDRFDVLENKRKENISMGRPEFDNINQKTYDGSKKALAYQQQQLADTTKEVTATTPKTSDEFVESIIAQTETGDNPDQPLATQPGDTNAIAEAGLGLKDQDPGFFQQSVSVIKDVLGDMFSSKDIARIAIQYVGSRALGYAHNGSLNYAMKEFAMNKKLQQKREFDLIKANAKNYSTASYNEYIKTGNPSVLKAKGTVIEKPAGSVYITGYGQAQSWQDAEGIQYIKSGKSWVPLSTLGDLVQPYDKEIHGDKAVINSFSTYADEQVKVANANYNLSKGRANDKDYDTTAKINPRKVGEEANSLYRNILRSNGININNADYVRQGIQAGIDSYTDAVAAYQAKGKEGNPPGNLESYVRQQMITSLTGINQVQVNRTLPQNLSKLDKKVRAGMDIKNPRKAGYADEYRAEWDSINTAWAKVGPTERAKWDQKAADRNKGKKQSQWNGFTLWADRTSPEEIQSINQGVAITQ